MGRKRKRHHDFTIAEIRNWLRYFYDVRQNLAPRLMSEEGRRLAVDVEAYFEITTYCIVVTALVIDEVSGRSTSWSCRINSNDWNPHKTVDRLFDNAADFISDGVFLFERVPLVYEAEINNQQ